MLQKIRDKFRGFMVGRYGTDKLGTFLLILGLVLCLVSSFTRLYFVGYLAYIPLILAIVRMYSRNIYARKRENQKFLQIFTRLRDRQYRYYTCPRCRQTVRVPRGKGKISIRCPACGERFERKS